MSREVLQRAGRGQRGRRAPRRAERRHRAEAGQCGAGHGAAGARLGGRGRAPICSGVLIEDRAWLARAATRCRRSGSRPPVLREVYEALLRSPENVGSAIFLEQLSPDGAEGAGHWLDASRPSTGSPDLDRTYVDACRSLEARPLRRQLDALDALARTGRSWITAENFDAVVQEERRAQAASSRAIFPEELLQTHTCDGEDVDAR